VWKSTVDKTSGGFQVGLYQPRHSLRTHIHCPCRSASWERCLHPVNVRMRRNATRRAHPAWSGY